MDNAAQARTVNGLVFTRDKSKNVEPTLIYSSILEADYTMLLQCINMWLGDATA